MPATSLCEAMGGGKERVSGQEIHTSKLSFTPSAISPTKVGVSADYLIDAFLRFS